MERLVKGSEAACIICGTNYAQKSLDGTGRDSYEFSTSCPQCGYNPCLERKIEEILERRVTITITTGPDEFTRSPSVRINSDELTNIIICELKKYWPRNLKNERDRS